MKKNSNGTCWFRLQLSLKRFEVCSQGQGGTTSQIWNDLVNIWIRVCAWRHSCILEEVEDNNGIFDSSSEFIFAKKCLLGPQMEISWKKKKLLVPRATVLVNFRDQKNCRFRDSSKKLSMGNSWTQIFSKYQGFLVLLLHSFLFQFLHYLHLIVDFNYLLTSSSSSSHFFDSYN